MVSSGKVIIILLSSTLTAMASFFGGYMLGRGGDLEVISDDSPSEEEPNIRSKNERRGTRIQERSVEPLQGYILYTAMCDKRVEEYKRMVEDVQRWCDPACEEELSRCKSESEEYLLTQLDPPPISRPLWAREYPRHMDLLP